MSERHLALATNADLTKLPLTDAIEAYSGNFQAALPSHIPLERFKRVVQTAISQNPDLARADRRSLFNACVKCAQDGLYPDGREAALVVFGGTCNYMPMIQGIRKRLRNSGEVLSAIAEVVYHNDKFIYTLGDNPSLIHEPLPFGQDRGAPVGAYAIIKLTNGEIIREVLNKQEIDKIRSVSRAANTKGGPWDTWWTEMARKSTLRRAAKAAPSNSDLEQIWNRDNELVVDPPKLVEVPPRPQRSDFDAETGEVTESPKRRGRPPKAAAVPTIENDDPFGLKINPEDNAEQNETPLVETVLLGLAGCKTPEDVDAIEKEHADAIAALDHESWVALKSKIDARHTELLRANPGD